MCQVGLSLWPSLDPFAIFVFHPHCEDPLEWFRSCGGACDHAPRRSGAHGRRSAQRYPSHWPNCEDLRRSRPDAVPKGTHRGVKTRNNTATWRNNKGGTFSPGDSLSLRRDLVPGTDGTCRTGSRRDRAASKKGKSSAGKYTYHECQRESAFSPGIQASPSRSSSNLVPRRRLRLLHGPCAAAGASVSW